MERSTPLSASRKVELTPLHTYADDDGSAKPSLTVDELWEKAHRELDALIQEFASPEAGDLGTDAMGTIAQLADDMTMKKLERTNKVRDGMDHVAELRRRVEEAREDAEPSLPREVREERLKNMEQQHKDMVDDILRNSARTTELKKERDRIIAEYDTVKQRVEELQKDADEKLSFNAYLLNILMQVTSTTINTKTTKYSDEVSGIVKTEHGNLVPFGIERSKLGDFQSVNYLWSLITDGDAARQQSGGIAQGS